MSSPFTLRRFQTEALSAIEAAPDRRRHWVSMPPGSGKTIVATELIAAHTEARRAVVLVPNTAIQGQWIRTWECYGLGAATSDRCLPTVMTVLTYQSLATFDPDEDSDAPPRERLHENGRALIAALASAGPLVVVLDECHHLLEVWGELLADVLEDLPDALVLGLTATPPTVLNRRQADQVDELFGSITYQASIPAAVREGVLAPFAELAWLTEPTLEEKIWLKSSVQRFDDLVLELLDPTYGSVPMLAWVSLRFDDLPLPWAQFEADESDLARAALRLVHADLLDLPLGARIREEHRFELTAADWAALIDDWITGCLVPSNSATDQAVLADLKAALPGIGYQVGRRGVSPVNSVIDRVLSRSAAKLQAVRTILEAEHRVLGDRNRAVVVCDFERATPTSSALLRGAPEQFGSAIQLTEYLVDSSRLRPVLVTGRTVAASLDTAHDLIAFVAARDRDISLEVVPLGPVYSIVGSWSSRSWVHLVSEFFGAGRANVLIGTRGLLGEGWDAPRVNVLVDLSVATTTPAVVQTRGRALRIDPDWSEKVAVTWSVVCIAPDHPGGDVDYRRLVRKHDGYFGIDGDGQVVSGVAHVNPRLSPYAPPPLEEYATVNVEALESASHREVIRSTWRVGEAFQDRIKHVVRVRSDSAVSLPALPDTQLWEPGSMFRPGPLGPIGAGVRRHPWRAAREVAVDRGIVAYAWVIADAMCRADLGGTGPSGVSASIDHAGQYRLTLEDVDEATSALFAQTFDELVGIVGDPGWLVAQQVPPPPTWREGVRVVLGRSRPVACVWFAVPAVFARNRDRRDAFATAWHTWISGGELVKTSTPEGEAALLVARGISSAKVLTVVRSAWS